MYLCNCFSCFPKGGLDVSLQNYYLGGHCTILIASGMGIIVILRGDMHSITVEVGWEINKSAS
jgi:hypothetical protein